MIANINIGLAILFNPIPHARITVISELKLRAFSVITVDNKTPIGIVITNTDGKCRIIIIKAILKGMPYLEICFINVIKVSDAKMIEVKTKTPMIKTAITCFKIYLSRSFMFLYFIIKFIKNLFTSKIIA